MVSRVFYDASHFLENYLGCNMVFVHSLFSLLEFWSGCTVTRLCLLFDSLRLSKHVMYGFVFQGG